MFKPPDPAAWAGALQLLDQALDLPPEGRPPWLAALGPEHQHLLPLLRRLLDERRALETADFMKALPPVPAVDRPAGDEALAPNQRIGPYTLLRELGHGGMASVWLAERTDGAHGRAVALKLPYLGARARVIGARFARERQILSALTHPHIASVLDAGADGAQPWLAMEYVDGLPLTVHAQSRQLDLRQRLHLFGQVLQAVAHAHAQLVIHRDLKPSNVLVDDLGQVKLLDFGVAKLLGDDGATQDTELTQLGGRALTPQYASPEQIRGQPLGTASDVYSLGVLLYELLTGVLPYQVRRATPAALEEAILAAQVQPPSVVAGNPALKRALRGDVDAIVLKALAPRIADRYESCEAFGRDLRCHLDHIPISARPAGWGYRAGRLLRRHALAFGAATAVGVALSSGLAVAWWQASEARLQARRAKAVGDFLNGLFAANSQQQADPLKAQQTPAVDLMELGAQRIRSGFRDDPQTAQDLLQTVADLYFGMGRYDRGTALLSERVAVIRQQLPADRALLAQALLSLGGGQWENKQFEALHRTLDEARQLLDATGGGAPLQAGNWHFLRGDLRRMEDVPGSAVADYERALAQFERAEAAQPGSAVHLLHLMLSLAQEYQRAGRLDEARRTLRLALVRGDAAAATTPAHSAMTFSTAGRFYLTEGDFAAAEPALRRGMQLYVQSAGPTHSGVRITQQTLAQLLFLTGHRDEALAMAQATIDAHRRQLGASNPATFNALIQLARARQHVQDLDTARSTLLDVAQQLEAMPGQQARAASAWMELALLQCWRADGPACVQALQSAEHVAPQAFDKNETVQWQRHVVRGALALLQRRAADAKAAIDAAQALAGRSPQVSAWNRIAAEAELGALALGAGQDELAASLIRGADAQWQADRRLQPLHPLRALLLLRLGQLQLHQGQAALAVGALTESLKLREQTDVATSPGAQQARLALAVAQSQGRSPR